MFQALSDQLLKLTLALDNRYVKGAEIFLFRPFESIESIVWDLPVQVITITSKFLV